MIPTDTNAPTLGPQQAPEPQPEYARVTQVTRLTGLTRSTLYRLLNRGVIKGAMLPITGRKSGVRVFDMASIRAYINQHISNKGGAL